MDSCAGYLISEPRKYRGNWLSEYTGNRALWLELGCGKGRFTADIAAAEPQIFLLALEKIADAMIIAMERVQRRELGNVRFINEDAAKLVEIFAHGELSRIFINFCDPWPKSRDAKFRLTSPVFLRVYADLLPVGGQIHFKTDNKPLFDWSIAQLKSEGWQLSELTNDLHADCTDVIMTDYEIKFCAQGLKINRLVATKTDATLSTAAGTPPRLRNASLTDARGFEQSVEDNTAAEDHT